MNGIALAAGYATLGLFGVCATAVLGYYSYKAALRMRCQLFHDVVLEHWTTDMPFGIGGYIDHWGFMCKTCGRVLCEVDVDTFDKLNGKQ